MLQCNFDDLPVNFFLDRFIFYRPSRGSVEYRECIGGKTTEICFINCIRIIKNKCTQGFINNETCMELLRETRACAAEPGCIKKRLIANPDDPFVKRQSCLDELQRTKILPCLTLLKRQCRNADIVVAKTIRLTMNHVEIMMKYDPFLKVIHLVRDPRAIMASRLHIKYKMRSQLSSAMDILCHDLLKDIDRATYLHQIYPDRIMELPYELAAKERIIVLRHLYNYLDKHIKLQSINSYKNSHGIYGTFRNNSREIVDKWKSKFNKTELTMIYSISSCNTLVELMGYDM